jgi:NitT/TauT family transport system substrate-binding protein
MKTRALILCTLVLLALAVVGIGPHAPTAAFAATDQVVFALDWIVNGTHAGYLVALDKGFYAGNNLAVTIVRGYGSGDTIKRLAAGRANFAVADMGALVGARANDEIPVKAIGAVYGKAALGLLYLSESGIKGPKDLEGRTLGRSAAGASILMLPGFLKVNGVDRQKMKEVVIDATSFLPMLLSRKVDAVSEQSIHLPRFQRAAEKQGLHVDVMRFADFGLVAYGNVLMTTDSLVKDSPDLVRRFTQATLKGLAYAFDKPDEAVTILQKYHREVDPEFSKDELLSTKELAWSPEAKANGLGFISREQMTSTRDVVTSALSLKRVVPVEELYTTQFLPAR